MQVVACPGGGRGNSTTRCERCPGLTFCLSGVRPATRPSVLTRDGDRARPFRVYCGASHNSAPRVFHQEPRHR